MLLCLGYLFEFSYSLPPKNESESETKTKTRSNVLGVNMEHNFLDSKAANILNLNHIFELSKFITLATML